MNPERWERLKQLFHSALEHKPDRQTEFLREACAGDESLQAEVESMLARAAESPDFLESPALHVEAQALARELAGESLPSAPVGRAASQQSAPPTRPQWWMYLIAAVFVADFLLRFYCVVLGPRGFDFGLRQEGGRSVIAVVPPGSVAERSGLKPGDILIALDGQFMRSASDWRVIRSNLESGQTYRFDIERDGLGVHVTYLMERVKILERQTYVIWQINGLFLLATALLIGFSRPHDHLARTGALALAALSGSLAIWAALPWGCAAIWRNLPLSVGALLWVPTVCSYLVGPILLTFFALFPRPLFRARWPWAIVWLPGLCWLPFYLHDTFLMVYRPLQAYGNILPAETRNLGVRFLGLYCLASLAAIAINYYRLTSLNERRRLRVLLIGGAAGVLPGAFRLLIWQSGGPSGVWGWLSSGVPAVLVASAFVLFPASFAYSILRHRLLDIRVIIRQGVRYAVTRGALLSVVPVLAAILVVDLLAHGDQPFVKILEDRGWVYAGIAVIAVGVHSQRRRWGEAIDRRFFRERYDARRLLREVAGEAARARSFAGAAAGVVARIEGALHPEFVAIMQRESSDTAFRGSASFPPEKSLPVLAAESSLISSLRIAARPLDVLLGESTRLQRQLPAQEIEWLRMARVDLLVPIVMTREHKEALLALGAKRSEEPYTREEKELLEVIAANLTLPLEREVLVEASSSGTFEECAQCGTCCDSGSGQCTHDGTTLTPVPLPRTLAGRYRLERRLGRGGMGTVYEGRDMALGRRVAVKVIREDYVHSAAAARRFEREARATAAFNHPNVVIVYDYGVEAGMRAFLVMELLEGSTLREELKFHGRLDAERVVEIFRPVCQALDTAHRHQLIHRDLKPENIFLVRSGDAGAGTVKALDFGLAKFLEASEDAGESESLVVTESGVLVGTRGYMSPEQLFGERPAVSWDLWALAVTAYEVLTGTLPFPVADRDKWQRSVLAGNYVPLSEHLKNVPASWQEFFARSLAVDRRMRPGTASELFRHLELALA